MVLVCFVIFSLVFLTAYFAISNFVAEAYEEMYLSIGIFVICCGLLVLLVQVGCLHD